MMNRILFTHTHLVVDGNREYLDGALLVNGETIEDVFINSNNIKKELGDYKEINLNGKIIMPGFFDTHTHGACSVEFNSANKEDIEKVSLEYAKHGTTSFFTTLTNNENLVEEIKLLNDAETSYSRFLGIHLEGPFVNENKRGVLKEKNLLSPDKNVLNSILDSSSLIKQMTIAPELVGSKTIADELNKRDIKVMLGHSLAIEEDTTDIDYDGFTHLFNAMTGFNHRELGLVNVAFNNTDKYCELIGDGKHIDKSVLKVAMKCLRKDRIMLISDSILMAGMPDGEFVFEGEACVKKGNCSIRKNDGRLAGNAGFISDEIKVIYSLGISLTDILLMTSLNAYRFYGLDQRYGSLVKGKYADIVILDDELNIDKVYIRGKLLNA